MKNTKLILILRRNKLKDPVWPGEVLEKPEDQMTVSVGGELNIDCVRGRAVPHPVMLQHGDSGRGDE